MVWFCFIFCTVCLIVVAAFVYFDFCLYFVERENNKEILGSWPQKEVGEIWKGLEKGKEYDQNTSYRGKTFKYQGTDKKKEETYA